MKVEVVAAWITLGVVISWWVHISTMIMSLQTPMLNVSLQRYLISWNVSLLQCFSHRNIPFSAASSHSYPARNYFLLFLFFILFISSYLPRFAISWLSIFLLDRSDAHLGILSSVTLAQFEQNVLIDWIWYLWNGLFLCRWTTISQVWKRKLKTYLWAWRARIHRENMQIGYVC